MKDYLPKNRFSFYLTRMGIVLLLVAALFFWNNQTFGISVSEDGQALICSTAIPLQRAENIDFYYRHIPPDQGLRAQICTFAKAFDNSDADRAHLAAFSMRILEFPLVGRWDIAQYFYRRIVAANPDDALSLYLRTYKLDKEDDH